MENKVLTDHEKLSELQEIINKNLYAIFTAFVLDMDNFAIKKDPHKLESYVRLKELLGITRGINKEKAQHFDDFKTNDNRRYMIMMRILDNRLLL